MARSSRLTVHFPEGTRSIDVGADRASRELTDVLRRADLPLNTRCGRRGLCDGCLVELMAGELVHGPTGRMVLPDETASLVRACEHRIPAEGTVEIRVPTRSLLAHEPQVVTSFRTGVTRAHEPLWQRVIVHADELDPNPSFGEAVCRAVFLRLDERLPVRADESLNSLVPQGAGDFPLVAEYRGDCWSLRPLARASGATAYGVAVDLGTTTVVVMLVDLANGEIAGMASAMNAQTRLGDNVLTRINHCLTDKGKIRELQAAVTEKTLAPLLDEVLTAADVSHEQVVSFSVAGNTTMLHLLAGIDPSEMGMVPFTPRFLEHRMLSYSELPITTQIRSRKSESGSRKEKSGKRDSELRFPTSDLELGTDFETEPTMHLLPGAAAYVGADVTAGVFASGMAYRAGTSLLVDIGTNGEIVLKHGDELIGCATAAGPAFEGAGLKSGMRAGKGAISHIRLDGDPLRPQVEVIGGGKPIGVCGTAYVDFIAQARRHGLIGTTGRITAEWTGSDLVQKMRYGYGFPIADGRDKEPIIISEADIANLLQAKAAIAAGIVCLLARFDLASSDVETLYLAGGFGFHMDVDHLIACGMLPGFEPSQIEVVGNTSLAGAYLSLLDAGAIEAIKRISTDMEIAELNLEPDFQTRYIDQLWLP